MDSCTFWCSIILFILYTCMKDMVPFHTYAMANLKHDLFLCHVLVAPYGHCDDNQL